MASDNMINGLPLISESNDEGLGLNLGDLDFAEFGSSDEEEDTGDGIDRLGFGDDLAGDDFSEGLDLDASLLFGELDLSAMAFEYYNNVKDVQEKIQPPANPSDDNFTLSSSDFPYLESRYLAPLRLALLERAKAQAGLQESARLSPTDNATEIFKALSSAFPFHIGGNYNKFIEMCARKYENFLKLVTVSTAQATTKFEQLLDRERLKVSQFVFEMNGLLWHQVTIYLNDERIDRSARVNFSYNGQSYYYCGIIGSAMEGYNEYLKSNGVKPVDINTLTVGNLIDCVNYTLSFQNMAATLHLSQDEVTALSTGELLRRYILLEKDEDILDLSDFRPTHKEISASASTMFERVNVPFSSNPQECFQQLNAIHSFLRAPFYREGRGKVSSVTESISHEILYYLFVILESGIRDYDQEIRTSHEYLIMLTKFMIALMLNAPYVRPTEYFTPNVVPGDSGEFDLNYYLGVKHYSVREPGLLISVVGDQRSAYLIPFVAVVDSESRNVTCHSDSEDARASCPPCVVFPLRKLFTELQAAIKTVGAASKKMKIEGTTEYCYTPSLAWVVSRSYSSQRDIEEAHEGEQYVSRTSNPLLNTLLSYTNNFVPERFPVVAGEAKIGTDTSALYVSEGASGAAQGAVRLIGVLKGSRWVSEKGTISFDDTDGALVMRYFQDVRGEEQGQTVIAEKGDYDLSELTTIEQSVKRMPSVDSYVDLGPAAIQYNHVFPELRSINKRLCALNALEYEEELSDVRTIIARDLRNVVVTYHVDTLLACKLLEEYEELIKDDEELDTVNFNSFKALIHIVLGADPVLDAKEDWDSECRAFFERARVSARVAASNICIYLDQFDPNIMALQGLSNSETSNAVDLSRYMALHALPGVHTRLRNLEERMVLLRVLQEVGSDIAPILRKRSPMLTAYNDVTTADTLDKVESSLKSGMKGGKQFDAFPLTRKVLNAEVGGSTPILKYFALERNVHGIMATAVCSDDEQEHEIYERFYECLGLGAAGMPQVLQMDERAFLNAPFAISIETACSRNRGLLLRLIERGLLADTSARVDIYVLKAYDLIMSYGTDLFEMKTSALDDRFAEDYDDVTEYLPHFYSYVGSFLVSYCFLQHEAVAGEASNADRVVTFREGASGFVHSTDMGQFAEYDLVDLRTVISE